MCRPLGRRVAALSRLYHSDVSITNTYFSWEAMLHKYNRYFRYLGKKDGIVMLLGMFYHNLVFDLLVCYNEGTIKKDSEANFSAES